MAAEPQRPASRLTPEPGNIGGRRQMRLALITCIFVLGLAGSALAQASGGSIGSGVGGGMAGTGSVATENPNSRTNPAGSPGNTSSSGSGGTGWSGGMSGKSDNTRGETSSSAGAQAGHKQ